MKKYINKLNRLYLAGLFLLIGTSFTACNDGFLEIIPQGTTSLEEFIETPEQLQEALNGAYSTLKSGSFMGGLAWLLGELPADHLDEQQALKNGDWSAHYTRTTDIFLSTTRTFWGDGFKTIGRSNFVLGNMDLVEGLSAEDRTRITAECQFLRGLSFFELVRVFAQPYGYTDNNSHLGLPIQLEYSKDTVERGTVGEVYTQLISDLQAAAAALPASNDGYATSWAAKGYLSKVYFQQNDFANAYEMANDVIENGPFSFDPDLTNRFSTQSANGHPESVFELVSTGRQDNSGGFIRDNYRPNPGAGNVPNVAYSSYLFAKATANPSDLRGQLWYFVLAGDRDLYASLKFELNDEMDVPLVHLTELKLIRAESAAELGTNLDVAIQDLSDIRERAGLGAVPSGTSATALISIAREERELEMVSEGNRLHELKRQAVRGNNSLMIRGSIWNCPGLVAQIPDSELKGNPTMIPNEEKGCN